MINKKSQAATSVASFILSFLASSHHWLHMGLLLLLGGSTSMMSTMSAVVWIRRFMIIATLVTVLLSFYRLYKHRCKVPWVISITTLSTLLSFGFIFYTIRNFGW
ncbi:hypothetical protein P5G65_31370 [Paenibacillus chondroitinus]|uniref:Uncharacterized protein n=1 Tax=Paenibacillus chondroitinus TaxID=59842 RepID=A0ABU6DKW6_9BACL|nr:MULTISPECIES: hypothetical protein [Paenibacillus]MCY9657133.1 hypothetical protein [Paenibacillus anseongense]MEB4798416.1 hypothetical protein [Paenibacillus chondroitinus]